MAGLKPGDIECAELYDSFTITVALLLEDLGFCEKGEVGRFAREHLRVGGPLPINTDGGGLSAVHPGMRGMFLMTEARPADPRRGHPAGRRRWRAKAASTRASSTASADSSRATPR